MVVTPEIYDFARYDGSSCIFQEKYEWRRVSQFREIGISTNNTPESEKEMGIFRKCNVIGS